MIPSWSLERLPYAVDEVLIDWSSAEAAAAAEVARTLIGARSALPPGAWEASDPEAGLFLEVLNDVSMRAAADPAFLCHVLGSLAGHAFLFGSLFARAHDMPFAHAVDAARTSGEGRGWVL
ncbi:MAG: hypothetical protein JWM47_429 [Acidimicrobiales bacterium]|nr:hypothetical protein [Acidimicrobiales bacterium]